MKSVFTGLALMAICLASQRIAAEEALVWCFNDPDITTLDGRTIKANAVAGPGGENVNAIRVKAVDGDASSYLQLYAGDGDDFISLGDALAMPSEDGWILEPLFAGLGENYAHAGVQFMIELGTYSVADGWTMLAYGTPANYSELLSEHIQQMTATAIPASAWSGGAFMIPEPSGAMLMLWGAALLGLRRKRRN